MKIAEIKSCFVGPTISPEEFIPEHFFLFVTKGKMNGYDGNRHYCLSPGEGCIVRKNHLARYNKVRDQGEFEKVVFIFDEKFLKDFQFRNAIHFQDYHEQGAFFKLKSDIEIDRFLLTLNQLFYKESKLDKDMTDLKREELLKILLEVHPELADVLFDFGKPGRLDLEGFMQKNYKFNVGLERFAYLTGRSLSAFKRDFKAIFQDTPNRWLVKRRLQEAYFLLEKKQQKASDIFLDLGFEDLSHFSFAFKKQFGFNATELA